MRISQRPGSRPKGLQLEFVHFLEKPRWERPPPFVVCWDRPSAREISSKTGWHPDWQVKPCGAAWQAAADCQSAGPRGYPRIRSGPAAVTNRRAGCQPAPQRWNPRMRVVFRPYHLLMKPGKSTDDITRSSVPQWTGCALLGRLAFAEAPEEECALFGGERFDGGVQGTRCRSCGEGF